MPLSLIKLYHHILKQDIKTYNHYSWIETLAFLNSCTNPFLCYWKSRQIRQAVIAIPEKITCHLLIKDQNMHTTKLTSSGVRHAVNTEEVSVAVRSM